MKTQLSRIFVIVIALAAVQQLNAQKTVEKWFNRADTTYGFYLVNEPASKDIKGAIVLLDGYGGNASFLNDMTIDEEAIKNNMLVVAIPTGKRIYADGAILDILNIALREVQSSYAIPKNKFVIGGFSAGGVIALRYAELCNEKPNNFPIQPAAVFSVDAPVDIEGLYRRAKDDLQTNPNSGWGEERNMIIDVFEKALGKPEASKDKWTNANIFNVRNKEAGNEKFLYNIPFRTYHEIDVKWYLDNKQRSIYGTNMLDASELVKRLMLNGNKKAEFVQSPIKGVRANGERNPHSWNVVDAAELIQWANTAL